MGNYSRIEWIDTHVGMILILGFLCFFLLIILYRYQKDKKNTIELSDLICIDGHIDEKKFTRFGAWVVSTWGFIYLILNDKFSEWFFAGYMTAWVGNALLDKFLNKPKEMEIKP